MGICTTNNKTTRCDLKENEQMKPMIGITMNYTSEDIAGITHTGTPKQSWNFIAMDYIHAIEREGGIPILIPAYANEKTAHDLISRCDGVILSGGSDITPLLYNEDADIKCGKIEGVRDRSELQLVNELLSNSTIPVLGICRGCQLLNVATGGTLYQDLPSEGKEHVFLNVGADCVAHMVDVKEDSLLGRIIDGDYLQVNSYHHQAVKQVGDGFEAVATAKDGIVEAIAQMGERFVLGVQWHPEMLPSQSINRKIITAFVEECSKYAKEK